MKNMAIWKKGIVGVAICSMTVGLAHAATVWNPASNGITPPAVGDWGTALNWTGGVPGASDNTATFNVDNAAECVVSGVYSGVILKMGDNGADFGGTLRIANGGELSTLDSNWSAIGYNKDSALIVEAGGTIDFGSHAWMPLQDATSTMDVYGTMNIHGMIGLGWNSGKGSLTIYDGGQLNLDQFNDGGSIKGESTIDLWESGMLQIGGDYTVAFSNNIAAGKILGNRLTNNLEVVLDTTTTPGVTNTVVTAIDSIPNLAGLTTNEAADVLAVFGYIVGTTTEGSAPGGITGLVANQVPAAGSEPLPAGSAIDLIVQEAGEIPNVVGLDYVAASNLLAQSGYFIGTETETYIFDAIPGLVTAQDPAGGTEATPGDSVNISFNERLAASSIVVADGFADWMIPDLWNDIVPERETQNYEVQIRGGSAVTLTNFVAMRRIHQGHNGTENGAAILNVMDGAHLVAGMFGDYAAVGWNADAELNVYSNGVYESREALRIAWAGGNAIVNIDGGSIISGSWMSLGSDGAGASVMTIQNGGSLFIDRFNTGRLNGVITMHEGTFTMTGTNTGEFEAGLLDGTIVIAPGYTSSLKVIDGNAVLASYIPGYAGWAAGQGIGGENEDDDIDLRDNLYEYALNGDPKDDQDLGVEPVMIQEGGVFTYIHLARADDTNLVYTVQTKQDLVNGEWLDTGSTVVGTNVTGEAYNEITNTISTVAGQTFIQLKIEN